MSTTPASTADERSTIDLPLPHAMNPTHRCLALLAALACLVFASCNATPDKRILQYLNTDGFGNRYTGNAEEENWVAIGDSVGIDDAYQESLKIPNARVDIDGTVLLPELGAVQIAGLTRTEIEALLM